jgi:SAM-dependent methyltransferase
VTRRDRWLTAVRPFVAAQLPPAPASVLEIGCGPAGGFVPALLGAGYDAVGIDPEAPEGAAYRRVEFEDHTPSGRVDAIVACTSLHHVADLDLVLDRAAAALVPAGTLVVVEWAWERFDEPTALWCFDHLAPPDPATGPGWLHEKRDRWTASERPWSDFHAAWAEQEGLHAGSEILRALDERFETRLRADAPYFFADLADVTEPAERAEIAAGRIRATGIRYVGARRERSG